MSALTFGMCYAGFMLLSLTARRRTNLLLQYEIPATSRAYVRLAGWSALLIAWPLAALHGGWGVAAVAWLATLVIAAVVHFLLLAFLPRLALALAEGAPLLMGIGTFLGI